MSTTRVVLFVLALHVSLLFVFSHFYAYTPQKTAPKKIAVSTRTLKPKEVVKLPPPPPPPPPFEAPPVAQESPAPSAPEPVAAVPPTPEPEPEPEIASTPTPEPTPQPIKTVEIKTPPKPKAKPKEKKPAPKKAKATTPTAKKPPAKAPAKAPPKGLSGTKKDEIVSLMKKGLKTLNSSSGGGSSPSSTSKIGALGSESLEAGPVELSYADELALYLKHRLQFPDEGKMKLSLTLNREGKVLSFTITSSSSAKNKDLLQSSLNGITFPPFGTRFSGEKSKTFALHLNIDSK